MLRRTFNKILCAQGVATIFHGTGYCAVAGVAFSSGSANAQVALSAGLSGDSSGLAQDIGAAMARGARKITISGNLTFSQALKVPSGVELTFLGTLKNQAADAAILLEGVRDTIIRFVDLVGDGTNDRQSGIALRNSSNCAIYGRSILATLNKGIEITSFNDGVSDGNSIFVEMIGGASGPSGAAVSIFGRASQHNRIARGVYSDNRIGVTINGGEYNEVTGVTCNNNKEAGVMIDGMVSRAADGGRNNVIRSIVCNGNGGENTGYGGLYLGNGASYNKIFDLVAEGNFGAGCRMSGGDNFQNRNNNFRGLRLRMNRRGGFVASASPETIISDVLAENNSGPGINIFKCDGTLMSGKSTGNSADGVLIQSAGVEIRDFVANGNRGFGVHVAYGGSGHPQAVFQRFSGGDNVLGDLYTPSASTN